MGKEKRLITICSYHVSYAVLLTYKTIFLEKMHPLAPIVGRKTKKEKKMPDTTQINKKQ